MFIGEAGNILILSSHVVLGEEKGKKRIYIYLGNDLRHFTMEKVRKDVLVVLVFY